MSQSHALTPMLPKRDGTARLLIYTVSFVVFAAVVILSRVKLEVNLGFDIHVFALINAVLNSLVSVLLILGLLTVRNRAYVAHKNIMLAAIGLSVLFLISYITHHLLAGDTRFGDADGDGLLSATEVAAVGGLRYFYYVLLSTHIFLAAVILPFILFTAYRSLTGEYARHRRLARYTWPLWLYVSVTGVIVYVMIAPYYS